MSYADILKKLAETNAYAAELLAAREQTKVKIEHPVVLEVVPEPEKARSEFDILYDPETDFDTFIKLANKLDGFTKE
jgi:hypothetical protein